MALMPHPSRSPPLSRIEGVVLFTFGTYMNSRRRMWLKGNCITLVAVLLLCFPGDARGQKHATIEGLFRSMELQGVDTRQPLSLARADHKYLS
jgi:hypothetical protein